MLNSTRSPRYHHKWDSHQDPTLEYCSSVQFWNNPGGICSTGIHWKGSYQWKTHINPCNIKNLKESVRYKFFGIHIWNFYVLCFELEIPRWNIHPEKNTRSMHTTDFTRTHSTWRSVMTFAQGKLYEDRAALLNITSNTANQRVNKINTTMSEDSK